MFLVEAQFAFVYCDKADHHAAKLNAPKGIFKVTVPTKCNIRFTSFTLYSETEHNGYRSVVKTVSWSDFVLTYAEELLKYNRKDVKEDPIFQRYGFLVRLKKK